MDGSIQSSSVLFQMDSLRITSQSRILTVLVFHFFLIHICRGQPPILKLATLGADIILPCHVDPTVYETDFTLEWTRPDLNPRFVFVWRSDQELVDKKHESFVGRTSLFPDELKHGNISLKLSNVKISDEGTYKCFIPALEKNSFIQLLVVSDAISVPVISLSAINKAISGVVLQCESAGWYPEPELLWLDGEGNLLSAGPTETLRGPDDLYTVSSRVTVEKRHSNNITCRVQQRNNNQSRETHIHVPDDFFPLVCSPAVPIIVCLTVSTILIVASGLFMFKWGKQITKTRRNQLDEMEKGEKYSYSQRDINQEENEHEKLMAHEPVPPEALEEGANTSSHLLIAKHAGEEAGEDMENKAEMNETEEKQGNQAAESQSSWFPLFWYSFKNLHNTQHGREDPLREVTTLKEKCESKPHLKSVIKNQGSDKDLTELRGENEQAENQKQADKKLSEELRETQKQLDNKTEENIQIKRHEDSLMASINTLKDEKEQLQKLLETSEKELEKWKETTEGLNEEVEKKKSEISELKTELKGRLKEEIEKREQLEKEMEKLKNELKTKVHH